MLTVMFWETNYFSSFDSLKKLKTSKQKQVRQVLKVPFLTYTNDKSAVNNADINILMLPYRTQQKRGVQVRNNNNNNNKRLKPGNRF